MLINCTKTDVIKDRQNRTQPEVMIYYAPSTRTTKKKKKLPYGLGTGVIASKDQIDVPDDEKFDMPLHNFS